MLSRRLAARCACPIIEVEAGPYALALLSHYPIALVIMDLGLPGIDGLEMTRRIRALSSPASQVPILMLSAFPAAHSAAIAHAAGCNEYIQKPILDFEAFSEAVLHLLAGSTEAEERDQQAACIRNGLQ
jgi:CheY-like chemotaxis protein